VRRPFLIRFGEGSGGGAGLLGQQLSAAFGGLVAGIVRLAPHVGVEVVVGGDDAGVAFPFGAGGRVVRGLAERVGLHGVGALEQVVEAGLDDGVHVAERVAQAWIHGGAVGVAWPRSASMPGLAAWAVSDFCSQFSLLADDWGSLGASRFRCNEAAWRRDTGVSASDAYPEVFGVLRPPAARLLARWP
jgi:hypothetical protein